MKAPTDDKLLASASTEQIVALKQAVQRAASMKAAEQPSGPSQVEEPELSGGDLEAELEQGVWKDEAPTSEEERECLTLLQDHFRCPTASTLHQRA